MSLEKKIYREWAFTGKESEKASINREIYKELCEKYKISRYTFVSDRTCKRSYSRKRSPL